jgi:spore protease
VHFDPLALSVGDAAGRRQAPARAVADLLAHTAKQLAPDARCVLVACLGNPRITPDSLGPGTARALEVTRHVQLLDSGAFTRFGKPALCAVVPGVLGDTGIEAAELIRGAVRQVGAQLVIAVDALAASRPEHLGAAVQISDRGLRPGAGVGNRRVAVDAKSVGCPVISLGMPTVIDGGTLLCDALSRAGICGVGEELEKHLASVGHYLVAPADIDAIVLHGGALLARAIGACFGLGDV